jgi:hypothetical protein
VLGKKKGRAVLLPFQLIVLLGVAITYTVVSTPPLICGYTVQHFVLFGSATNEI